ncbi:MAG: periplasmic heavy metal sensor [Ignavibacteriales bacterium]|nr:periplasmic heavy metal sensor [Ignavibacteriales bacterium]
MKQILFFMLIAASLTTAQPSWNDDDAPFGRPAFGRGMIIEKLELKPDQEKQFESLRSEMQKKQIDIRSNIQTLRIDMRDFMNEDSPSQSKIESKINEISKLQNEMKMNHLNFWFGVNKILTPEQQKIWKNHSMKLGGGAGPRGLSGMKGEGRHMKGRGKGFDRKGCCERNRR